MAEDGLDEPWDPAQETSLHSQSPPTYIPHPISFNKADETFQTNSQPSVKPIRTNLPQRQSVDKAIQNLKNILHPPHHTGHGYKDPKLPMLLRTRLELMVGFLRLYQASDYTGWVLHADAMATAGGKGPWLSRKLREWSIVFCNDLKNLPTAQYGKFNTSILEDEDVQHDISLHLQSLGK